MPARRRDTMAATPSAWALLRTGRAAVRIVLTSGPYPQPSTTRDGVAGLHRKPPQLADVALGSLPGPAGPVAGEEAAACEVPGFIA
jgi:hypothetical protein